MAALTENIKRDYGVNTDPMGNDLPLAAGVVAYEGGALEVASGTGFLSPAGTVGDATALFAGIAQRQANNTLGADGDLTVRVQERGTVELPVTGLVPSSVGKDVYATTDNDFNMAATGFAVPIGKVRRFVEAGIGIVAFEAADLSGVTTPIAPAA